MKERNSTGFSEKEQPYGLAADYFRLHARKQVLKRILYAGAALCPENAALSVSHYEIAAEKIPAAFDGFRIVQLSDLHGRLFGKDGRRLLAKIKAQRPDMIAVTGDFADEKTENFAPLLHFAASLRAICPVCFVSGNHEQKLPPPLRRSFLNGLREQGVEILDNTSVHLERNGQTVDLRGVRVPLRYYRWRGKGNRRIAFSEKEMERLAGFCGPSYTVLLAHNPLFFEAYAAWGADLSLCGHVHGGLFRLPGLGGLLSPERKFFPRYSAGIYRIGDRVMEVSRGLGKYPRVNNLPEIVSLTLRSAPGHPTPRKDVL